MVNGTLEDLESVCIINFDPQDPRDAKEVEEAAEILRGAGYSVNTCPGHFWGGPIEVRISEGFLLGLNGVRNYLRAKVFQHQ